MLPMPVPFCTGRPVLRVPCSFDRDGSPRRSLLRSSPMARVLVVDDIAANRHLIEALIAPDGHVVRTAGDGAEALRLVRANPPDLVLMDVVMPRVDGLEACRAMKQDPGTRLIPVVLLTSLEDTESRIRAIEAGADDIVSKPFNGLELRARVRSLLRIKGYTHDL